MGGKGVYKRAQETTRDAACVVIRIVLRICAYVKYMKLYTEYVQLYVNYVSIKL